jgi:hypothetical protein
MRTHSSGPGSAHILIRGVPRIARPDSWATNPRSPAPFSMRRTGWNAVGPGARIACLSPCGERAGPDLKPSTDYHRRSLTACRSGPSGQPSVRSRPDPARRGQPVRMGRGFPSENARAMTTSLARAPSSSPNHPPLPDNLALALDGKEPIRAKLFGPESLEASADSWPHGHLGRAACRATLCCGGPRRRSNPRPIPPTHPCPAAGRPGIEPRSLPCLPTMT